MTSTTCIPAARPSLSAEAALVLGLAGTSLPFSDSLDAEVERWLRILRLHGRTGRVLQALGVGETSLSPAAEHPRPRHRRSGDGAIDLVSAAALDSARSRGVAQADTEDVLAALLHVYGRFFEDALERHGTSADEVLARLA